MNRLADRAGRHRRIAVGFSLLTVPMLVMGFVLAASGEPLVFTLSHFAAAGSLGWLARDLVVRRSLVNSTGIPHLSVVSLCLAFGSVRISCPEEFEAELGLRRLVTAGLLVLGLALITMALGDRSPDPTVGLAGRLILIVGGATLGLGQIGRMINGYDTHPLYALSLGVAGLLLLALSGFEARLVLRAFQLVMKRQAGF